MRRHRLIGHVTPGMVLGCWLRRPDCRQEVPSITLLLLLSSQNFITASSLLTQSLATLPTFAARTACNLAAYNDYHAFACQQGNIMAYHRQHSLHKAIKSSTCTDFLLSQHLAGPPFFITVFGTTCCWALPLRCPSFMTLTREFWSTIAPLDVFTRYAPCTHLFA